MQHMGNKRYNMREAAKEIGVTRQTLYYWIKKEWIKPKRDYRNFPVFTDKDLKQIKEWKDKLC
jgi:DNA-binding transcriptional MerR regulator